MEEKVMKIPPQQPGRRRRFTPEQKRKLEIRIKELERALGRKTMEVEILQEAVRLTQKKKSTLRSSSRKRRGGA